MRLLRGVILLIFGAGIIIVGAMGVWCRLKSRAVVAGPGGRLFHLEPPASPARLWAAVGLRALPMPFGVWMCWIAIQVLAG